MKNYAILLLALVSLSSACGPSAGTEGGPCLNTSFDATSCNAGLDLECIDTCEGDAVPLDCGPTCTSCDADLDGDGICAG